MSETDSQQQKRLVEMETKLAYQEDLLQSLNDIVAEQSARVGVLEKKIESLAGHLKEALEGNHFAQQVGHEVPPHY